MDYKPNVISMKFRVTLAIAAICLFIYMCAGLATGYTYLPAKRGGFLLSGLPTLIVVIATSGLFLAAVLTIIDHYDKRPNETSYVFVRRFCLKGSLFLFIVAPFVEIVLRLLHHWHIDIFPHVHGLAENYTFYSPKLITLVRYIEPIRSNAILIVIVAIVTMGAGVLIDKYFSRLQRLAMVLISVSLLSLSILMLGDSTQEFLSGTVKIGRGSNKSILRADQEPAKFKAVLLTRFSLGSIMLTASMFTLLSVGTVSVQNKKQRKSA